MCEHTQHLGNVPKVATKNNYYQLVSVQTCHRWNPMVSTKADGHSQAPALAQC